MHQYLKIRPDDATAHFNLAMLLRNDEARAEFERSIVLAPAQTDSYVELADFDALQGQYAQAIDKHTAVLARALEHNGALAELETVYYLNNMYAESEPVLAHSVQVAPR